MRENSSHYKFEHGLRQYGDSSEQGLKECYNVVPRRGRLVAHEALTVVSGAVNDWPFPQLFCLSGGNYLCGRNYIKKLDSNLAVTASYVTVQSDIPWSAVDFWDYAVFTNGAAVYVTDLVGGVQILADGTIPIMNGISDFKGQLIGIGVTGYEENEVVHGAIGAATFDRTVEMVETGSVPMKWQGGNVAALRLADRLVVYGEGGIGVLEIVQAEVPAFRKIDVLPSSVQRLGVYAVGGDDSVHCFLDETGSLWRVTSGFEMQELGYREFFEGMLDREVRISFDPRSLFRDFYICDGQDCYLLTEFGLAKVHQLVASVQSYRGGAIGTFADSGDMSWLVKTDSLDMGLRARKTLEWVELRGSSLSSVKVSEGTIESGVFPVSPSGRANSKFSGTDLDVSVYGASYSDMLLETMIYRWKLSDKSSIRGEYASNAVTRTTR